MEPWEEACKNEINRARAALAGLFGDNCPTQRNIAEAALNALEGAVRGPEEGKPFSVDFSDVLPVTPVAQPFSLEQQADMNTMGAKPEPKSPVFDRCPEGSPLSPKKLGGPIGTGGD